MDLRRSDHLVARVGVRAVGRRALGGVGAERCGSWSRQIAPQKTFVRVFNFARSGAATILRARLNLSTPRPAARCLRGNINHKSLSALTDTSQPTQKPASIGHKQDACGYVRGQGRTGRGQRRTGRRQRRTVARSNLWCHAEPGRWITQLVRSSSGTKSNASTLAARGKSSCMPIASRFRPPRVSQRVWAKQAVR